jgi:hypothetical protein
MRVDAVMAHFVRNVCPVLSPRSFPDQQNDNFFTPSLHYCHGESGYFLLSLFPSWILSPCFPGHYPGPTFPVVIYFCVLFKGLVPELVPWLHAPQSSRPSALAQ